jgi:hypothetical protein
VALDEAVDLTRTGDVWLFRGHTAADRAIQVATNSPVNHVGMSVVIGDLPPLMWHAELGRSLPDVWSGTRQRGVQLHDLRAAVQVWGTRYGQRAWLRQLDGEVTTEMEDADRADGRHPVPLDRPAEHPVAVRAGADHPAAAADRRPGDRVLRRGTGRHLSGHGAPAGPPPAELV